MAKVTSSTLSHVAGHVAQAAITQLPRVVSPTLQRAMARLMDMAIDGGGKLPSAKILAGKTLEKKKDLDKAINSLITGHTAAAASQGFIANIGGIVSTVIGMPINVTGIVFTQTRLAAAIAHLHGYDVDDPRVRTAIAMCLLGEREMTRQIKAGELPSTPLAVATSPVIDEELHSIVIENVFADIVNDATGKGLIDIVGRKIPLAGGAIGGVVDSFDTIKVSRCVRKYLVLRRPPTQSLPVQSWPLYDSYPA